MLAVVALIVPVPSPSLAPTPDGGLKGSFDFKRVEITNSVLTWKWTDYNVSPAKSYTKTWRAGSGENKDECDKSYGSDSGGWLPAATYKLKGMFDNKNDLIKARAIYFEDKVCSNGVTWRTGLFIHTEETAAQGQSCDQYCWNGVNDYKSKGCIKVSYADMPSVHSHYHTKGGDGRHEYYDLPAMLVVHS